MLTLILCLFQVVFTQQGRLNLQLMRSKLKNFDAEWLIHTGFGVTVQFELLLGIRVGNCSVRLSVLLTSAGSVQSSPPIWGLSYQQTGSLSC